MGVDRKSADSAAHSALLRVGLDHLAQSYPHELSGGEQQRVALAGPSCRARPCC
jgi:ABC-type polar amino acid transport system ATPase subunit